MKNELTYTLLPLQRWYVNGEVTCFTGSHIALALLSILVLVAASAIIPLSVLLSLGYNIHKVCSLLVYVAENVHSHSLFVVSY